MKAYKQLLIVTLLTLFSSSSAVAQTTLKQINIDDASKVTLLFDQKVNRKKIKVEYFRDIVQVSIRGVSIYPAKVLNVRGKDLKKVFAYQYTPSTVRCRLTVKGDAKNYRGKVNIASSGKVVAIGMNRPLKSATPAKVAKKSKLEKQKKVTLSKTKSGDSGESLKEKELFDRIMKSKSAPKVAQAPKESPFQLFRAFSVITIILLALAGFLFLLKRAKTGQAGRLSKKFGLDRLTKSSENNSINVLNSHYLGPKKSILIVEIMGRKVVLGVTENSINYITHLSDKQKKLNDQDEILEDIAQKSNQDRSDFDSLLDQKASNQSGSVASQVEVSAPIQDRVELTSSRSGVRDQIKKRLEGMKSL